MSGNSEYWAERFKLLEESTFVHSEEWRKSAEREFNKSLIYIKDKVAWFYTLFKDLTGMSLADAKRAMETKSLKEFKISVEEYIRMGESLDTYFDPDVLKQLRIASTRVRVSRYEAIQWFIESEIARLYAEFQVNAYEKLGEAYENRYYQTAYEMRSLGFSFARLNKPQIMAALEQPWKDVKFSETIWSNQKKLQKALTEVITQSVITGKSYTEATKMLEAKMHTGSNNCSRIITTEMAAVSSKAQQDMFKELNVKKYVIVATLDDRTSQICQSLDGKVFDQKDYEVGVTAPPFHINCRTSTAPYFKDMKPAERIARKDGNGRSEYVENMTYLEWAKENNIKPVYGLWDPTKDINGVSYRNKTRIFDLNNPKDVEELPTLFYYDVKDSKADKISIGRSFQKIHAGKNEIIDHFQVDRHNSFIKATRRFFDEKGNPDHDIDYGDHGISSSHAFNHYHKWEYDEKKKKWIRDRNSRELTEKEYQSNIDFLGDKYE